MSKWGMIFVLLVYFSIQIVSKNEDICITRSNEEVKEYRREEIKKAFLHAYNSYERCCFGSDEIRPVSNDSRNEFGGMGATIIDNLDTMILFGLDDEFKRAREFVKELDFRGFDSMISVFETIIRVVGGLLSAYDLSKDVLFLEKAKEISDIIMKHSFHGVTGLPRSELNMKTGRSKNKLGKWVFLSEIATLNMEFSYLSHHTGDDIYREKAENITEAVSKMNIPHMKGLYPNMIDIETLSGRPVVSLGAHGDSAYEYFLKGYLLSGEEKLKEMYDESLSGIRRHLLKRSRFENFLYVVEMSNGKVVPKMDHLVCFLPGTIALGAKYNQPKKPVVEQHNFTIREETETEDTEQSSKTEGISEELITLARELLDTCIRFYDETGSNLGPEIVHFYPNGRNLKDYYIKPGFDSHYLLRPETVESIFYLYRLTKDEELLETGWRIFLSLVRNCRTHVAFSGIRDVLKEGGGEFNDVMESFFLAETLKYLFLLFSDDQVLSFDKYVFTTEAHPLSIFRHERKVKKKEDVVETVEVMEEEEDYILEEKEEVKADLHHQQIILDISSSPTSQKVVDVPTEEVEKEEESEKIVEVDEL